jgi:hypothetical protein
MEIGFVWDGPSSNEKMVWASFAVARDINLAGSPPKLSPGCVLASHVSLTFGSFSRHKSYNRKSPIYLGFWLPQPRSWVESRNKHGLKLLTVEAHGAYYI